MNRTFGGGAVDEGSSLGANMELRSSLEYYNYYHSQKPDAGLAPPLYDWSSQGGVPTGNAAGPAAHAGRGGRRGMGVGMRQPQGGVGAAEGEEGWNEVGQMGLMLDELSVGDSADETTPSASSAGSESWASAGFLQKSIIDRIQEDFPRTPSPVWAIAGLVPGAKPAHAKALPSPSPKAGSKAGSSPHLSSPSHSRQQDEHAVASLPTRSGTVAGLSPLQSPSILTPVLESAGLGGAGASGGGYHASALAMHALGVNNSYAMDTSHMTPAQSQQQHAQQQMVAAALHNALQNHTQSQQVGMQGGYGMPGQQQAPPGFGGGAGANQQMPMPFAQNPQMGGQQPPGYGGGNVGGGGCPSRIPRWLRHSWRSTNQAPTRQWVMWGCHRARGCPEWGAMQTGILRTGRINRAHWATPGSPTCSSSSRILRRSSLSRI